MWRHRRRVRWVGKKLLRTNDPFSNRPDVFTARQRSHVCPSVILATDGTGGCTGPQPVSLYRAPHSPEHVKTCSWRSMDCWKADGWHSTNMPSCVQMRLLGSFIAVLSRWRTVRLYCCQGSATRGWGKNILPTNCCSSWVHSREGLCTQRLKTCKYTEQQNLRIFSFVLNFAIFSDMTNCTR